jgi:ferredoxin-NADP reductase
VAARLEWLAAEAVAVVPEGRLAARIVLDVPGWPGHLAGQHLDIRLTAEDGYQAQRSYSVGSAPGDPHVELVVERVPDGEVSSYLAGEMRVGDRFEVRGPIGRYFTWDGPADGDPLLLVAGGTGIVPLVSIARRWAALGGPVTARLLRSVRSPEEAVYSEALAALAGSGLAARTTFTRRAPAGWRGPSRRIDAAMLAEEALPPSSAPAVYVCGSTPFVERVATLLVDAGHAPERIRTERFGPTGTP